jgi:ComF family protein
MAIAEDLAPYLRERIIEELADYLTFYPDEKIVVIPVPLSKDKLKRRGYNQAAKLAQALTSADMDLFKLEDKAVMKIKETTSQVLVKDRHKRLNNLKGSFHVTLPISVAGKTVLIIDDVLTTGGTILEMQKILINAGARRVFGLAVAHG